MLKVDIVSPIGLVDSLEVDSLTVKLTSGYRTILGGHTPLIGVLDYASMHVVKDGKTEYYAIHGGALNITKEKATLIVNGVEHESKIDVNRSNESLKRAKDRLSHKDEDIDIKRAELSLKRALARISAFNRE